MKQLQDDAIPILKPLIMGIWDKLTPDDGALIATWYTMVVANVDADQPPPQGVTPIDRAHLLEKRSRPDNWWIWIGKLTGGDGYCIRHRGMLLADRPVPNVGRRDGNAQATTIQLGQLLLHAVSLPAPHDINHVEYGRALGIFPVGPWGGHALDWRTAPFLTVDDAERVANAFHLAMLRRK